MSVLPTIRIAATLLLALTGAACRPDEPDPERVTGDHGSTLQPLGPADPPEPVHPDFDLDRATLDRLIAALPADGREAARTAPRAFLDHVAALLSVEPVLLLLVDKTHRLPADYVPDDLVPLSDYRDRLVLNRSDLSLRTAIVPALLEMVRAAAAEGIALDLSSTYRSFSYQRGLFERHVAQLGLSEASLVSAEPGASQHQLGTTIDFGSISPAFADHPAGIWLAEHATRFGFSLSYPRGYRDRTGYTFEPWHFRYIGRDATAFKLRYFGGLQQDLLEYWHANEPLLRAAYRGDRAHGTRAD